MMIIQYLKDKFKPKFYNKTGELVEYLEYHKKEQMITIKTINGIEKIPVLGLDKQK